MSPSQWRVLVPSFIPRPETPSFAGKQPQAYLVGSDTCSSQAANSQWYADSGTTHHITNYANQFLDKISISGID